MSAHPPLHHYTGTFLGQPVDMVSPQSQNDLFVEQVIKVCRSARVARLILGETIRTTIRDTIYSTLTTPDVITKTTPATASTRR